MQINIKKPSELDKVDKIESLHISASGDSIACWCPSCGAEITFGDDWPIDIVTVCTGIDDLAVRCNTRFTISDDTPIEE